MICRGFFTTLVIVAESTVIGTVLKAYVTNETIPSMSPSTECHYSGQVVCPVKRTIHPNYEDKMAHFIVYTYLWGGGFST